MTMLCEECGRVINHDDCACSLCGTESINISGSGNLENPFSATPNLDPDADNILTCEDDGLLVQLPSAVSSPPRCHVTHNANQSVANDTNVVLAFNTERYDTDTMHDTATNNSRITFTTAGLYIVTLIATFASTSAAGDRALYIRKNGRDYLGGSEKGPTSTSFETGHQVTVQEMFQAGEYVEAIAKQDSGSALNLLGNLRYSPNFSAIYRRGIPA